METLSRHGDWLRVARFSLYQLVGHPVKSKPPTLAASPASSSTVLPQIDALAAEGLTEGVSEFFFKKNALACEHTTRESPALRAISTMPALSHICATLRRVTETCLFIKKKWGQRASASMSRTPFRCTIDGSDLSNYDTSAPDRNGARPGRTPNGSENGVGFKLAIICGAFSLVDRSLTISNIYQFKTQRVDRCLIAFWDTTPCPRSNIRCGPLRAKLAQHSHTILGIETCNDWPMRDSERASSARMTAVADRAALSGRVGAHAIVTGSPWALLAVRAAPSGLSRGGGPPNWRCVAERGRRTDTWRRSWAPQSSSVSAGLRTVRGRGATHCQWARGRPLSTSVRRGQEHSASLGGGAVRQPLGPALGRHTGALGRGYALSQSIYGGSARHAVARSMALNRTAQPSRPDVTPILFPPSIHRTTRPLFYLPSSSRPLMSSPCHLHPSRPAPPVLPVLLPRV